MRWLVISLVLSVALTVLLNVGLRAFPDAGRRVARRLAELTQPSLDDPRRTGRRARVVVPWKAMIVGSILLTIAFNVALRIL